MFGNVTALEGLHVTGKSRGLGLPHVVEPEPSPLGSDGCKQEITAYEPQGAVLECGS